MTSLGSDADGEWAISQRHCPACSRFILHLQNSPKGSTTWINDGRQNNFAGLKNITSETLIRPKAGNRVAPNDVPDKFKSDFTEASLVLGDSPKAAAALGRRCLQNVLREVAAVKAGNLADEIQQVIDSGKLPSDLSAGIDAIRNIGNFAAHPMKSQHSGEILDVEQHEAEWTLDVLEELFDFYFVRPAERQRKRDALNQKLAAAGKPALK